MIVTYECEQEESDEIDSDSRYSKKYSLLNVLNLQDFFLWEQLIECQVFILSKSFASSSFI